MKILCYHHQEDQRFAALVSALNDTGYTIGHAVGEINHEAVLEYNPDIIIHNIPDADKFPSQNKSFISIGINDLDSPNCFSFTKNESKNYISPFVILKDIDVDEKDKRKYLSDIVYFGTPLVFNKLLEMILNDERINFKFFDHKIHNINGYCGVCNASEYNKFYTNAKVCLVRDGDINRLQDIVACGGNPVVYNNSNHEECMEQILNAMNNGSRFTVNGLDRDEILKTSTSFDRTAHIFKSIGLTKLSNDIIRVKNQKIGKYK